MQRKQSQGRPRARMRRLRSRLSRTGFSSRKERLVAEKTG